MHCRLLFMYLWMTCRLGPNISEQFRSSCIQASCFFYGCLLLLTSFQMKKRRKISSTWKQCATLVKYSKQTRKHSCMHIKMDFLWWQLELSKKKTFRSRETLLVSGDHLAGVVVLILPWIHPRIHRLSSAFKIFKTGEIALGIRL